MHFTCLAYYPMSINVVWWKIGVEKSLSKCRLDVENKFKFKIHLITSKSGRKNKIVLQGNNFFEEEIGEMVPIIVVSQRKIIIFCSELDGTNRISI